VAAVEGHGIRFARRGRGPPSPPEIPDGTASAPPSRGGSSGTFASGPREHQSGCGRPNLSSRTAMGPEPVGGRGAGRRAIDVLAAHDPRCPFGDRPPWSDPPLGAPALPGAGVYPFLGRSAVPAALVLALRVREPGPGPTSLPKTPFPVRARDVPAGTGERKSLNPSAADSLLCSRTCARRRSLSN
jgi:hypothetical protein